MRRVLATSLLLLFLALAIPVVAAAASEDDLYQSALQALKAGNAQTATNLFTRAIQGHADDHRYYNDRGVAYKVQGNPEKALSDYTKAIELKPEYVPALNNRGVLYLQQGSPDQAIADFTEALKHGGLESKILTNVGWAYAKKEDHRNAVTYFEKALAARPLDPRSFILMAQSLESLGDGERALKMYQLGVGLLHDRDTAERVEKKIADIERGLGLGNVTAEEQSGTDAPGRTTGPLTAAPSSPRQTLQPRSVEESAGANRPTLTAECGVDTLDALDRRARATAIKKLSSASADIYRQGLDFVEKSDLNKALVRFEDTLNVERRKKNQHGVAWSSLEIGRVFALLGDHVRAVGQFDVAEKVFRRLKASDESVLALIELANARTKAGQKEQATLALRQAAELAGSAGHHRLAKLIDDFTAGRAPQTVVVQRPPASPVRPSYENPLAQQTAQPRRTSTQAPLTPPAPAEQKRQILAAATQAKTPAPAGETRNSGQADAAAKASQPLQATSPPRTSQATPSPQPPYLKKEDRPSPNARTIVRAEAKPAPPVPAQQSKPASVQTPLEVHGGVEAGMALSASVPSEPRKAARVPPDGALEKSIKADVIALKRFRDADDEAGMIMVLERLASNYLRRKDHRKASHCLAAAVVFREKLGLEQGKERVIQQRGLVREILGDSTGALEDFTWALALSNAKSGSRTSGQLELRSKKLANQMRLDEHKALAAYRLLWKARKEGDPQGETEACYTIAGLYEKANKPTEAVSYYERSIASILADKARVYQKMGNAARAEESYALALETFRKLDYPKYVNLMKQLKAAKTLSKQ